MTEEQINDGINRGDINAIRFLYKDYYIPLCVYARHFTGEKEIAEEVVQDVFIKLWENRYLHNIQGSIKSYLFISVRNQSLNHLKHLQVVRRFNEYYTQLLKDAQDYYLISQETGDSLMIAKELKERILKEVELLPDQCRKILKMSRFEGLKHQEIADNLGITINTVHRQTSIALNKLRLALKNFLTILVLLLLRL